MAIEFALGKAELLAPGGDAEAGEARSIERINAGIARWLRQEYSVLWVRLPEAQAANLAETLRTEAHAYLGARSAVGSGWDHLVAVSRGVQAARGSFGEWVSVPIRGDRRVDVPLPNPEMLVQFGELAYRGVVAAEAGAWAALGYAGHAVGLPLVLAAAAEYAKSEYGRCHLGAGRAEALAYAIAKATTAANIAGTVWWVGANPVVAVPALALAGAAVVAQRAVRGCASSPGAPSVLITGGAAAAGHLGGLVSDTTGIFTNQMVHRWVYDQASAGIRGVMGLWPTGDQGGSGGGKPNPNPNPPPPRLPPRVAALSEIDCNATIARGPAAEGGAGVGVTLDAVCTSTTPDHFVVQMIGHGGTATSPTAAGTGSGSVAYGAPTGAAAAVARQPLAAAMTGFAPNATSVSPDDAEAFARATQAIFGALPGRAGQATAGHETDAVFAFIDQLQPTPGLQHVAARLLETDSCPDSAALARFRVAMVTQFAAGVPTAQVAGVVQSLIANVTPLVAGRAAAQAVDARLLQGAPPLVRLVPGTGPVSTDAATGIVTIPVATLVDAVARARVAPEALQALAAVQWDPAGRGFGASTWGGPGKPYGSLGAAKARVGDLVCGDTAGTPLAGVLPQSAMLQLLSELDGIYSRASSAGRGAVEALIPAAALATIDGLGADFVGFDAAQWGADPKKIAAGVTGFRAVYGSYSTIQVNGTAVAGAAPDLGTHLAQQIGSPAVAGAVTTGVRDDLLAAAARLGQLFASAYPAPVVLPGSAGTTRRGVAAVREAAGVAAAALAVVDRRAAGGAEATGGLRHRTVWGGGHAGGPGADELV